MKVSRDCWKCEYSDCGHIWIAAGDDPPRQCAKCRRRKWHTPDSVEISAPKTVLPAKPKAADIAKATGTVIASKMPTSDVCKYCGSQLVPWGTAKRCMKCERNF